MWELESVVQPGRPLCDFNRAKPGSLVLRSRKELDTYMGTWGTWGTWRTWRTWGTWGTWGGGRDATVFFSRLMWGLGHLDTRMEEVPMEGVWRE